MRSQETLNFSRDTSFLDKVSNISTCHAVKDMIGGDKRLTEAEIFILEKRFEQIANAVSNEWNLTSPYLPYFEFSMIIKILIV